MKKEYIPWICLYMGLAGLIVAWQKLPAKEAQYYELAVVGITWCRIVTFVYLGVVLDMVWYDNRTPIFNGICLVAEAAIMVALWRYGSPAPAVGSAIAIALYEHSRARLKHHF